MSLSLRNQAKQFLSTLKRDYHESRQKNPWEKPTLSQTYLFGNESNQTIAGVDEVAIDCF